MAQELFIGVPIKDYQVLDYIESTGAQYIDTGISMSSDKDPIIEIDFQLTSFDSSIDIGIVGSEDGTNGCFFGIDNGVFKFGVAGKAFNYGSIEADLNRHIAILNSINDGYSLDGVRIANRNDGRYMAVTSENIYAFKINGSNASTNLASMKLYSLKIYDENSVLMANYIPVQRLADNELGLYNSIDNTFLEGVKTENFIKGENKNRSIAKKVKEMFIGIPSKLPNEYQQVKYLESTGTQWIDTGVPAFSKNRTEIDLQFTDLTKTSYNGYGRMTTLSSDNHNIGSLWSGSGEKIFLWESSGNGITQTADTNRHIFFLDNNNEECGLDNIIVSTDYCYNESSYQEGETLHLFAMKWYDLLDDQMLIKWKAYEKVYGAKYYLEGVLVRDFIPCIRKSDNKPGMYDLVNNQFYINQGTEEFLIGEKITSARKVKEAFMGINGIAKKIFEVTPLIINFTIGGVAYQADEGMTWKDWLNSGYNENGWR